MDVDFALFQQVINRAPEECNVAARFYDKAVKTANVNENGLPIFKNVTYVEIRLKDNNTEVFNQPASAEKIRRFPREYMLYKQAKEQAKEGTPLEQFAFLNAAEIATCKNRGIFTVEALADLSFDKVQSLGLQNEHVLAQMFVENASNNNELSLFVKKEHQYKEQIARLQEQIAQLQKEVEKNKAKSRKKKGDAA